MMKQTNKKFIVELEFRQRESFEVEAEDERQSEMLALEIMVVPPSSIHFDTKIIEVKK